MQKTADVSKTISICQQLQSMKMTPKEFMECFITSADPDIAYQRQFWATDTGVDSTIALVTKIGNRLVNNTTSCAKWQYFIQEEVRTCACFSYIRVNQLTLSLHKPSRY
jgi:hypothetical protein